MKDSAIVRSKIKECQKELNSLMKKITANKAENSKKELKAFELKAKRMSSLYAEFSSALAKETKTSERT